MIDLLIRYPSKSAPQRRCYSDRETEPFIRAGSAGPQMMRQQRPCLDEPQVLNKTNTLV